MNSSTLASWVLFPGMAIISATNRADLIDSALRERLGQIELQVKRPDAAAARDLCTRLKRRKLNCLVIRP